MPAKIEKNVDSVVRLPRSKILKYVVKHQPHAHARSEKSTLKIKVRYIFRAEKL